MDSLHLAVWRLHDREPRQPRLVGKTRLSQPTTIMEYYSSLDASQLDSETPTLFELISANQLEALLSPSLRYILVHYAQLYPRHLLRITNRFDELNLLLRSFIEWYFIHYWHGSFTENFYGIKRVSQTPLSQDKYNSGKLTQLIPSMIEERRKLSSFQIAVSIFEVTGLSYLLEKCSYQYELLYSKFVTNQLEVKDAVGKAERVKVQAQRAFVKGFPYLQASWRFSNLATTLMYMSGAIKSPSLLTFLFKMNYARLNQYDYSRNEPKIVSREKLPNRVSPPTNTESLLTFLTTFFVRPSWRSIRFLLGTFFPLAIFSLKFLEWWNNSEFAQKVAKSQRNALEDHIPAPTSLHKLKNVPKKQKIYKSGNTCPLCKEEILNPAIIETGYVFCYTCIFNYLKESHRLVGEKTARTVAYAADSEAESEDEEAEAEDEKSEPIAETEFDISKGGRCPITGQKLLGCRWNPVMQEFEVDGIRRLIF